MSSPLGSSRYQNWVPHDLTGTRLLDTPYVNDSGATRMCMIGVQCAATAADEAMAGFQHVVTVARLVGFPAGIIVTGNFAMTFVVPLGASYQVNTYKGAGGAVTLQRWIEVDL